MKRLVLSAFFAALLAFLWGFIFWTTSLSSHVFNHTTLEREAEVGKALNSLLGANGAYQIPDPLLGDPQTLNSRAQAGPIAMIHFRAQGAPAFSPRVMAEGFGHMFLSFLLLGLMLMGVAHRLPNYGDRAQMMVLLALGAALWSNLGDPIWFHQSWRYHALIALYDAVALSLGGLVLAAFIKPRIRR
jgi:hypothetical protein